MEICQPTLLSHLSPKRMAPSRRDGLKVRIAAIFDLILGPHQLSFQGTLISISEQRKPIVVVQIGFKNRSRTRLDFLDCDDACVCVK